MLAGGAAVICKTGFNTWYPYKAYAVSYLKYKSFPLQSGKMDLVLVPEIFEVSISYK